MYSCGAASCNHVRQPRATCIASYRVGAFSRRAGAGGPAGADERTSDGWALGGEVRLVFGESISRQRYLGEREGSNIAV